MLKNFTQIKSALAVAALLVAGMGNAWGDTTVNDGAGKITGSNFTLQEEGTDAKTTPKAIVITGSGVTVSGDISGYYLIIKNTQAGASGDMSVTLSNVVTGTVSGSTATGYASSVVIINTGAAGASSGAKPTITFNLSGVNQFVNSNAPGFLINPSNVSGTQPCTIKFETTGESTFIIGSSNESYWALQDDGSTNSTITFNSKIKYDNILVSRKASATSNEWAYPEDADYTGGNGDSDAEKRFNSFLNKVSSKYHFFQFRMNANSASRGFSSAWGTFCFPFSGTVGNGELYTLEGKVMNGTTLQSLVLKKCDDATALVGGKPYVVHRTVSNANVTYAISESATYASAVEYNGMTGVYNGRYMDRGDYFLNGGFVYTVAHDDNWCDEYRAFVDTPNNLPTLTYNADEGKYYNGITPVAAKSNCVEFDNTEAATFLNTITSDNQESASQAYDLQGRKISNCQKGGLYIINGKKIIK